MKAKQNPVLLCAAIERTEFGRKRNCTLIYVCNVRVKPATSKSNVRVKRATNDERNYCYVLHRPNHKYKYHTCTA
ncbi:hypothetical protein L596_006450 [Steinernema carpocapsae]|uniref:Uncharacterized protein n=1 Tax=Steinernema carpocapsae TaxID=34508 RepID=A0A4U8V4E6_STECR|nr:hypothetical protein L596_006450 [Steinernema carpocapsae]